MSANPGPLATIRGIISPAGWSERGEVTRVRILTPNEDEYIVYPGQQSRKLLRHLHESLSVTGRISIGKNGEKVIRVSDYEVLPTGQA